MLDPHHIIAAPTASGAAAKAARLAIRAATAQWGSSGPQAVVDALEKIAVDRMRAILHR